MKFPEHAAERRQVGDHLWQRDCVPLRRIDHGGKRIIGLSAGHTQFAECGCRCPDVEVAEAVPQHLHMLRQLIQRRARGHLQAACQRRHIGADVVRGGIQRPDEVVGVGFQILQRLPRRCSVQGDVAVDRLESFPDLHAEIDEAR